MNKKVRVTLEVEESFIRRLNATVELGIRDYVKDGRELPPDSTRSTYDDQALGVYLGAGGIFS